MVRTAVKEAIQKLTEERARLENERAEIDRALDALRPLAEDPSQAHRDANAKVQNGHDEEPTGHLATLIAVLKKKRVPLTAKAAHLAMGRRAPNHITTTNSLFRKALERGLVTKDEETEGRSARYTVA